MEEGLVVSLPDAVVQPVAVMVELLATSIAASAVFRIWAHVTYADRAPEDVVVVLKFFIVFPQSTDNSDNWIYRVG